MAATRKVGSEGSSSPSTGLKTGRSAIEEIARVYGNQAVVISIDPRRVYVDSPEDVQHRVIKTDIPGPKGEIPVRANKILLVLS